MSVERELISVTDLQKNTKACLLDLNEVGKKIILSNNKPQAVVLSISEFERLSHDFRIKAIKPDTWEKKVIDKFDKKLAAGKTNTIPATKEYFDSLK